MTDDSGSSPEAQAAIAEARSRPAPQYAVDPAQCEHPGNHTVEIGRGYQDTTLSFIVHLCQDCGFQIVSGQ